ncbi:hypothetical protein AB434_2662 [Heyndrickxia coagulans]|uniref:Uncharacterized protein n=1 Tax=Heyndrickxia coagulans TaxID=1398 RepID=A0AAN0T880_HEYCO|nr:hypothetical protein SB48_HM08orf04205 [Heyndrickxia coagulans]AKN55067.1 hypothetical protein AB434_2662 [Heyndrickxia coagulans]
MLTFRQKIEISFLSEMKKQQEIKKFPANAPVAGREAR